MQNPKPARAALMRDVNFRWLLAGGAVSMFGDQLTVVALPWLVLRMTGDALAIGGVVAMLGLPQALFMLFGGALVDRYSPKRILMLSKYANAALLALLSWAVLSDHLSLWLVYALASGIGLASAFGIPAATSLLPHVVEPRQLQMANAIQMGLRQLTLLVGPLAAALLIALGGHDGSRTVADVRGIGLAFGLDCLTFMFSAWTLSKVYVRHSDKARTAESVWTAVREGLANVWHAQDMRACFAYWALVVLCIGGTMQVALPILASTRLDGVASLGFLMGAHAAGTLIGMLATGLIGQRRIGSLGTTILAFDAIIGILLIPLGVATSTWQPAVLLLLIGSLAGYMQVAVFTWLQQRVPARMLGRTMSIFMFIFMGLAPLSALGTGVVLQHISVEQWFIASGLLLLAIALLAYNLSSLRYMKDLAASAPLNRTGPDSFFPEQKGTQE